MAEQDKSESREQPLRINPYTLLEDQHGWRGLSLPGNHKRKVYTILQNDHVLVTGLLLMPGEVSIRHSHESGELSIHYLGELRPQVSWNPPGVLHSGAPPRPVAREELPDLVEQTIADQFSSPEVAGLARQIAELQRQIVELQERLETALRPTPAPFVIVDILFPPFKTTIDDPNYPDKKTVTGQWYD